MAMMHPAKRHLTSVGFTDDQLQKLQVIGEVLHADEPSNNSVAAMVRQAVDEFTARELARPEFRQKAAEVHKKREETIDRVLSSSPSLS